MGALLDPLGSGLLMSHQPRLQTPVSSCVGHEKSESGHGSILMTSPMIRVAMGTRCGSQSQAGA